MNIVILFTFINKLQLQYMVTNIQNCGTKVRESHPITSVNLFHREETGYKHDMFINKRNSLKMCKDTSGSVLIQIILCPLI